MQIKQSKNPFDPENSECAGTDSIVDSHLVSFPIFRARWDDEADEFQSKIEQIEYETLPFLAVSFKDTIIVSSVTEDDNQYGFINNNMFHSRFISSFHEETDLIDIQTIGEDIVEFEGMTICPIFCSDDPNSFMVEDIPRIMYANSLGFSVVTNKLTEHQKEQLKVFSDVCDVSTLQHETPVVVAAKTAVGLSQTHIMGLVSPWAVMMMNDLAGHLEMKETLTPKKIVFESFLNMNNYKEVEKYFTNEGFVVVDLSEMGILDRIQMMKNAEFIVAGCDDMLTYMMFCDNTPTVLTLGYDETILSIPGAMGCEVFSMEPDYDNGDMNMDYLSEVYEGILSLPSGE